MAKKTDRQMNKRKLWKEKHRETLSNGKAHNEHKRARKHNEKEKERKLGIKATVGALHRREEERKLKGLKDQRDREERGRQVSVSKR